MAYRFDQYDKSIVIDGWENGIAESPYGGISDIRNCNIISVKGEASVGYSVTNTNFTSLPGGLVTSADPVGDTITSADGLTAGMALYFDTSSVGGITAGDIRWVKAGTNITVVQLSTTPALSDIVNITSTGSATFHTIDMGQPSNRAYSIDSNKYYMVDTNGRAWQLNRPTDSPAGCLYLGNTTLTNTAGNGLIAYRGYLFVFRDNAIDYMNLATLAWTYGWQTMNTNNGIHNSHYAHIGQDDTVYFCDAAYVGSFFQKPGKTFDPSDSTTYTYTSKALALPSTDIAQCIAELGINLLVGGRLNAIYPWDRISTSFTYPILLAEQFITRMVTINTNTYIFAGNRGRIYITNGSQVNLFKKVPDHISGDVEPYFVWGDAGFTKNQLYFGTQAFDNAGNLIAQYGGLWALDIESEALRLSNKLSNNVYSGLVTCVLPVSQAASLGVSTTPGSGIWIGWKTYTPTYGVDVTVSNLYTNSEATIDTDLIPIGTYEKPRDMTRIEYKLSKALVSGESITIKYRLIFNTQDTGYTTVLTDSTAGNFSLSGPINFKNAQWVQFQIVLNSTNTNPSKVRLREIRIIGIESMGLSVLA